MTRSRLKPDTPLVTDQQLETRVRELLRTAGRRQLWMMFLYDDAVQAEIIMPLADLPASPDEVIDTPDLGTTTCAEVLGARVAGIMRDVGLAHAVFVWERRGRAVPGHAELRWARRLGAACAAQGAAVRAQFLLHDRGVRLLAPDKLVDTAAVG